MTLKDYTVQRLVCVDKSNVQSSEDFFEQFYF